MIGKIGKFFRIAMMLSSAGLGLRLLEGAYHVLFGGIQQMYPEVASADPDFVAMAQMGMSWDIVSGLLLIFWPFYLGWLKDKG